MASNNNKNKPQPQQQQQSGYGPNPGASGSDPRGRVQNQMQYQQQRYESQQGPLANAMAQNYGRGSEANYGDYTDIMNNYRDIYSGGGGTSGGGGGDGGGGGGGYSAFTVNPERVTAERANTERASTRALGPLERVTASDPYNSYKGFQEFSNTGGYTPQNLADMRARGVAPLRAAYANAARNVGQQRSLQGGYSPNAIAAQIKMAREQGQGMADAAQNVEAGIAQGVQQGRLSGLQGMGNIEQARQNAQMQADLFNAEQSNLGQKFDIGNELDVSKFNAGEGNQVGMFNAGQGNQVGQFNADLGLKGQIYNADAYTQAQARNNAAAEAAGARNAAMSAQNVQDRLAALSGARSMYGTTPGMAGMFGDQALSAVGQGGTFGMNMIGAQQNAANVPGQYEQTAGRVGDMMNLFGRGTDMASQFLNNRRQPQNPYSRPPSLPVNQNPYNIPRGGNTYGLGTPPPSWAGQVYDEG